jgi:iron complex transport system ATP-binding protein
VLQPEVLQAAFSCSFEVVENGSRRLFMPVAS